MFGLMEMAVLFLSLELAWVVRANQIGMEPSSIVSRLPEIGMFVGVVYLVMLGLGVYQVECYRSMRMAANRLGVAMLVSVIAISVILFFFPEVSLWRSITVYAITFAFFNILLLRVIVSKVVGWQAFRLRILVVGAGQRGARMVRAADDVAIGYEIAACIRLTNENIAVEDTVAIAEIDSLVDFCDTHRVDEIVIALDERRGASPSDKLLEAKLAGIKVSEISSFLERQTGRVDLRSISPAWLIYSDGFLGSEPVSTAIKRLFDICASGVLLLLSSPILVLTAILVKVTSRGPILYRQERVGQFGRTFHVLKFRSMVVDAEGDGKAQWAQQNDPRVTGVGRFIRASRIDELPQIFNVLRGDMSFVGPRPERPVFVDDLAKEIPYYQERHVVKPGITGWAQLNYPYGASVNDARHKLEYDLYYVKNYSLFLDIIILIQTLRVIVWQDGVR